MTRKWRFRDLKIVDNNTRDYEGGFTVEHEDWIVAGPYPAKVDAKKRRRTAWSRVSRCRATSTA